MDLFRHLHAKIAMLCVGAVLWCWQTTAAYADVTIEKLVYELDEGSLTAKVTGNTDDPTDVEIPSTITSDGVEYSVTEIGDHAFYDCRSLTSAKLPESLTTIGSSAFRECNHKV